MNLNVTVYMVADSIPEILRDKSLEVILAKAKNDFKVKEVEGMMRSLNQDLRQAGLTEAAQYATLFNHRIRFMMGMNLREFQHLAELRTQPAGHFSYRSMVQEMVQKVEEREPWTKDFLGYVDFSDPDNKISRANEQARIAGKNIAAGMDGNLDLK